MAFTQISVVGSYTKADGANASGAVVFTPTAPMHNGDIVISAPVTAQLINGDISASLAATNDPGTTPTGVTYKVVEYLDDQPGPRTYNIVVAYNGGTVNLVTAAPVVQQPLSAVYLTQAQGDARYELSGGGGGASTPADGSVTNVKVAVAAAITLDKTVDSTGGAGRLALTNAERTQLSGLGLVVANAQTGSYTFVLADVGKAVEITSASATTATVPPSASVAWPVGALLELGQFGAGQVTITPGAGVTLQSSNGLKLRVLNSSASLRYRGSNVWHVAGDVIP